ncbi:hypothetical protein K474DRAFT_1519613 [Panus rudis PR-1116 ss-1]|nr:hypothetical protein K474DRAFT_1519613 [Panus rudis PR-1116 ss-1]
MRSRLAETNTKFCLKRENIINDPFPSRFSPRRTTPVPKKPVLSKPTAQSLTQRGPPHVYAMQEIETMQGNLLRSGFDFNLQDVISRFKSLQAACCNVIEEH